MTPQDRNDLSRRGLIRTGALGLAAGALGSSASSSGSTAAAAEPPLFQENPRLDFTIERIDRTAVELPFREVPARNMAREIPHWRFLEVVEVHLACGHSGFGETMLFYTWGATDDADVERALGQNAWDILWDDSLGAGLQMALFDAVGRALGAPIHRLIGPKVHERTPLSWWDIDLIPEDLASECETAYKSGYLAFKTKGRPWFDIFEQVELASKVVPEEFNIDMDFNDTLLDAERGLPILLELEKNPRIGIYETPIPQSDIQGNQKIRAATRVPIAMHYGSPAPLVALKEEVCDGFVVSGGASRLKEIAAVCAMADKPFWLQLVGSSITAAYSLHFGGAFSHATWPAVNCHQLFADSLLTEPIVVEEGTAAVPDKPGLGFELDRDTLERYKIEKPARRPEPQRLIETSLPDGTRMYTANTGRVNFMLQQGQRGTYPYYVRGARTRLVPDDGSERWRRLYDRARSEGPITVSD